MKFKHLIILAALPFAMLTQACEREYANPNAATLQAGDAPAWLHPFDQSKAQRGLALFLLDNPHD